MIDARFIVELKGKSYPTYPGVLDLAHQEGLLSLETEILQYPSEANGWTAVVRATAAFPGADGRERVFSDVGDCSPKSTSPQLAAASIRLASTRAKGRVLRDATNVGQTLLEELPEGLAEEGGQESNGQERARATPASPRRADTTGEARASRVDPAAVCTWPGCQTFLSKNQLTLSQHHAERALCPSHLAEFRREKEAATR